MPVAPILAADGSSVMSTMLCMLLPTVPILILLLIWRFFRSAVRSGVSQAQPAHAVPAHTHASPAHQPPTVAQASMTEQQVRDIVRDEIRRITAERAARAAAAPRKA